MPLDKFFTSDWKRKPGPNKKGQVAGKMRRSWPKGSQYETPVRLEMREKAGGDWSHFLNVPPTEAERELSEWERNNPDHAFRVAA